MNGGTMNRSWKIAAWLLLVLVGLGMLSAAIATEGDPEPVAAVSVPVGAIGDHGVYSASRRDASDAPWEVIDPTRNPIAIRNLREYTFAFRVDGIEERIDRTGQSRPSLNVVRWSNASQIPDRELEAFHWRWDENLRVYVDLASRHAIQTHYDGGGGQRLGELGLEFGSFATPVTSYGPTFRPHMRPSFELIGHVTAFFEFQGRTFRVGDEIPQETSHLFDREWAVLQEGVSGFDPGTRVVRGGTMDGSPVVDLRTEDCFDLDIRARQPRALGGNVLFLHGLVPVRSAVCFQVDIWLQDSVPYPVLYEERIFVNGTLLQEWKMSLAAYGPGSAPIPWREPSSSPYRENDPTREVSPIDQKYPADGATSKLAYRLSAALAAVDADATLTTYRSWKQEHPDASLVGARYEYERAASEVRTLRQQGSNPMWHLVFGAPTGDYFVVQSARLKDVALPMNCDFGAAGGPAFSWDQLPDRPVTVAEIERAWEKTVGPGKEPPQYLRWGVEGRGNATLPHCGHGQPAVRLYSPNYMPLAFVGFDEFMGCYVPRCPTGWHTKAAMLDMGTGNLASSYDWFPTKPATLDVLAAEPPPQSFQPYANPRGPGDIVLLGVGSVLVVLGAAYLYPFLKFHGAQLLTFLPGYAKLRRSDLLKNELREQLVEMIRADPGISPPEMLRQVRAGWTTLVYHLSVLERNKLVSSLLDGRHKRFFPIDTIDWTRRGQLAALRNLKTRQVFEIVQARPGIIRKDIANELGCSTTAAAWHLERLHAVGLIGSDRDGRVVRLYAAAPAPEPSAAPEVG